MLFIFPCRNLSLTFSGPSTHLTVSHNLSGGGKHTNQPEEVSHERTYFIRKQYEK